MRMGRWCWTAAAFPALLLLPLLLLGLNGTQAASQDLCYQVQLSTTKSRERERERDRQRDRDRETETETETERECVCDRHRERERVCVCVCVTGTERERFTHTHTAKLMYSVIFLEQPNTGVMGLEPEGRAQNSISKAHHTDP